ncbi:major facilitator superfamily transporter [Botrytis cinerea]
MAFLGSINTAAVNPNLVLSSEAMGMSSKTTAHSTTTCPFVWNTCTNGYGHQPIALLSMSTTVIGGIGSASSPNFATIVGTCAICGVGMGGMMSVGAFVVNDMLFLHELGGKTGIYSIFGTNGAHIAALIGG